jgi:hypothetical protein
VSDPSPVPPPPNSSDKKPVDKNLTLDKAKRQIQILTEHNERLKRDLNIANQTEEGLMREMENTTTAVEDLMNQVFILFTLNYIKGKMFRIPS